MAVAALFEVARKLGADVFELGIDIAVTNAPELCAKQRDDARASERKSTPAAHSALSPELSP